MHKPQDPAEEVEPIQNLQTEEAAPETAPENVIVPPVEEFIPKEKPEAEAAPEVPAEAEPAVPVQEVTEESAEEPIEPPKIVVPDEESEEVQEAEPVSIIDFSPSMICLTVVAEG